ncbi:MAG TPA: serine/threonine-protein kinase, partial [Nannocystaceae bacterium]|nr:serine/threonine-protein kinase [Nannocystaceae bacterium]
MSNDDVVTAPGRAGLNDTLADAIVAAEVKAALFGQSAAPLHIGRFRVVKAIGQGAMGTVWLCRDDELARDVAVKLLRGRPSDERAQARMIREARALARLSHPNVVVVHEVGTSDRGVHVAMEHVRGTTLGRWLEQPRTPAQILAVLVQAGRGLAAAHRVGVVHRDFKPDNVLISEEEGAFRARVVDFGLARTDELDDDHGADELAAPIGLTRTGALIGTPAYMAPEQLERGTAGPASDQFAFCVTAFEALQGTRPFTGDSPEALLAAIGRGPAKLAARIESRARAAIERGLTRDAAARWPSMDALLAELAPPSRRSRVLVAGGAIAIAGVAIAWGIARQDPCPDDPRLLADAWDEPTRARVEQAFATSTAPYAAAVWASTSKR